MPRSSSSKEQVKFLSSLRWWELLFPPPREHSNRPQGLELVRGSSRERQQLSSRLPPPREDSSQPQILGLARECNSKQWELVQGEGPEDHHTRHVTGLLPHLARSMSSQRGLGPHPHPARSVCLRGPRPP